MKAKKLLRRILQGHLNNVAFSDFTNLVEGLGFQYDHTRGSHRYYQHPGINEVLNLQEKDGEAKPYQIKQVMRLIERYNLRLEGENE